MLDHLTQENTSATEPKTLDSEDPGLGGSITQPQDRWEVGWLPATSLP